MVRTHTFGVRPGERRPDRRTTPPDEAVLGAAVARSTIYRNWNDRTELLLEAVRARVGPMPGLVVGEVRRDFVALCRHLAELMHADFSVPDGFCVTPEGERRGVFRGARVQRKARLSRLLRA